jgi:hypothetical protein
MQARVGRLYGLTDDQFARVLETFPLIDADIRRRVFERFATPKRHGGTEAQRHDD